MGDAEMNVFRGEERDWTQQYAAIGEFVVEFEKICWQLRHFSCSLLQFHGLIKWPLAEIVFNQQGFTAMPLMSCFASLVAECLGPKHEVTVELGAVRARFDKLVETRNRLLHAHWIIGPDVVEITDNSEPIEMHAERRTPDKFGSRVDVLATTVAEIHAEIERARVVRKEVASICSRVILALVQSQASAEPRT